LRRYRLTTHADIAIGWDVIMADVNNKAWRHAIQKNALVQSVCASTTRTLDAQRRTLSTKLTREENDLRSQLMRLQGEQRTVDDPTYGELVSIGYHVVCVV